MAAGSLHASVVLIWENLIGLLHIFLVVYSSDGLLSESFRFTNIIFSGTCFFSEIVMSEVLEACFCPELGCLRFLAVFRGANVDVVDQVESVFCKQISTNSRETRKHLQS